MRKSTYCQMGGGTPCAYCHLHKLTLTQNQMKRRQCLQKKCRHLVPWKEHPIWEKRAKVKEARKARHDMRKGLLHEKD